MKVTTYSLYDSKDEKFVIEKLRAFEMEQYLFEHYGSNKNVCDYAKHKRIIQGRFIIYIDGSTELKFERQKEDGFPKTLLNEWDHIRLLINPLAKRC